MNFHTIIPGNEIWKNVSTSALKNLVCPVIIHTWDIFRETYNYFLIVQKHIYAIVFLFLVIVFPVIWIFWNTINNMKEAINIIIDIIEYQDKKIQKLSQPTRLDRENLDQPRKYIVK